jgi:hypothetical protein
MARHAGVSEGVVVRALARIVDRTRRAAEFRGLAQWRPPTRQGGAYSWSLESIRAARDDQMIGSFARPVRLAEAMRTDDALFTAYHNRIAPQSAVQAVLVSCGGTRGDAVQRKAMQSAIVPRTVLAGIAGTLANHGVAIGHVIREASDDGTRVDFRLEEWPLEHVRWNNSTERLETRTKEGQTVPIVHGDGEWIVFRKFADRPWTQEACVLPGALIYAAHGNGVRDWAAASFSHGQAKLIGELPAGVTLVDADGNPTREAQAFLAMMQDIVSGEMGAGIRPPGSKTDFVANGSTAWQVFSELIVNRSKAAARVYLGTDAILGSQGGAPGIDIAALFGVATTKIQGDFWAVEQGLRTGFYEPWTAINFGDSRYAPALVYQMPDPDAKAKAEEHAAKRTALLGVIKRMREEQMEVTQKDVDALAKEMGVSPAPRLAAGDKKTTPLTLAPTDVAKVVRVREARQAQGLDPFGDARDNMTITELDEKLKADAQAKAEIKVDAAAPPPAPAP